MFLTIIPYNNSYYKTIILQKKLSPLEAKTISNIVDKYAHINGLDPNLVLSIIHSKTLIINIKFND